MLGMQGASERDLELLWIFDSTEKCTILVNTAIVQ